MTNGRSLAQEAPASAPDAGAWRDILQGGFGILAVLGIGIFALVRLIRTGKKPKG